MKTRAVILAGGQGTRLEVLTHKRTKPAVPFAGKYRVIDFALSNCVNSNLFDIMIIAQYRPHSLVDHIGSGGSWDLDRNFTGGVRIYTPYQARGPAGLWVQTPMPCSKIFRFIKHNAPDLVLISFWRPHLQNGLQRHDRLPPGKEGRPDSGHHRGSLSEANRLASSASTATSG